VGNPRRGLQALACKLRLFYFPVALVLIAQVLLAYGAPIPARTLPSSADAEPKITKMDPPNWWVGFRPEVMILAAGQNLQGATVLCEYPGVQIARSEVTARGAYLFLWLTISEKAQAGGNSTTLGPPDDPVVTALLTSNPTTPSAASPKRCLKNGNAGPIAT